jgi:hypothetical protein
MGVPTDAEQEGNSTVLSRKSRLPAATFFMSSRLERLPLQGQAEKPNTAGDLTVVGGGTT